MMNEPWWKWPERWQMVDDYKIHGLNTKAIATKYRRPQRSVCNWLRSLGILRPSASVGSRVRRIERHPSESIRLLCAWIMRAEELLGRPPNTTDITRIMEEIRQMNGGMVTPQCKEDVAGD